MAMTRKELQEPEGHDEQNGQRAHVTVKPSSFCTNEQVQLTMMSDVFVLAPENPLHISVSSRSRHFPAFSAQTSCSTTGVTCVSSLCTFVLTNLLRRATQRR